MDVESESGERQVEEIQEKEVEEEDSRLMDNRPTSPPRSPTLPQPPVVPSGAFLTDFTLDDVLFTDIDTSMYDFGSAGTGPAGSSGPAKTVADDLVVRAIQGYGGGNGSGHQSQPFRLDLAELDHIMEVLVGS